MFIYLWDPNGGPRRVDESFARPLAFLNAAVKVSERSVCYQDEAQDSFFLVGV